MSWPTTDDPRTEFVTLRLTVAEDVALDTYARSKNFESKSAAVRDAIIRVINAEDRRAKRDKANRSDRV